MHVLHARRFSYMRRTTRICLLIVLPKLPNLTGAAAAVSVGAGAVAVQEQAAHHRHPAAEQHQGALVPAALPAARQVPRLRALRGHALAAERRARERVSSCSSVAPQAQEMEQGFRVCRGMLSALAHRSSGRRRTRRVAGLEMSALLYIEGGNALSPMVQINGVLRS